MRRKTRCTLLVRGFLTTRGGSSNARLAGATDWFGLESIPTSSIAAMSTPIPLSSFEVPNERGGNVTRGGEEVERNMEPAGSGVQKRDLLRKLGRTRRYLEVLETRQLTLTC